MSTSSDYDEDLEQTSFSSLTNAKVGSIYTYNNMSYSNLIITRQFPLHIDQIVMSQSIEMSSLRCRYIRDTPGHIVCV